MCSFQIKNIREIPGDPLAKFTNEISKKLSRFLTKDQLDLLDDKEDIYTDGQDLDTVVKVHDELISTKKFEFTTIYYPPTEPDLNKQTLWIRGRNTGSNYMKDWSGFDNEIKLIRAEPLLIDGTPFDLGIHTAGVKSTALKFNRPNTSTENSEDIQVTDNTRLQVSGISTGISYFIRFRIHSLAQQGSLNRTLFEKVDDSTPNNAAMLQVSTDGKLIFIVKRGGSTVAKETASSTVTTNTVYEVWLTYNVTGPAIKIYVNNVDKSLSDYLGSVDWQSDLTNHDLFVFKRGFGSGGYVYGDLYDFEVFREKVVSTTEVGHHFTNKWTLANIPFGQVMITNYWATFIDLAGTSSFTTTSFTTSSFNT